MKKFDQITEIYSYSFLWPFRMHVDIPTIKSYLNQSETRTILDYGCGAGFISHWLEKEGEKNIVGFDTSPNMLSLARKNAKKYGLDIIYTSSLDNYFETFDLALAIYIIPYCKNLDEVRSVVQSIYRVLKPNGRLILLTINPDFSTDSEYYRSYGFRLIEKQPRKDGSSIYFNICIPPYNEIVQAYYYSDSTLGKVILQTGFNYLQYGNMIADHPETIEPFFNYLQCPHAQLITAVKIA